MLNVFDVLCFGFYTICGGVTTTIIIVVVFMIRKKETNGDFTRCTCSLTLDLQKCPAEKDAE